MDNTSIWKQATGFLKEQKKNKRWHKVLICLAVIVALGTVGLLIMPGQAKTHTRKVLDCPVEVHVHTEDCWDKEEEGKLICGQVDFVVHTHNDDCYADGELVCPLPEYKIHEHTDACYKVEKVLVCGLEEGALPASEVDTGTLPGDGTTSGKETAPGEGTTDGETAPGEGTADCETAPGEGTTSGETAPGEGSTDGEGVTTGETVGEGTTSGEGTSDPGTGEGSEVSAGDATPETQVDPQSQVPLSAQPDTQSQPETQPQADSEEEQPHVHTEECYEEVRVLICEELGFHTHSEECWDEEGNLICEQAQIHSHDEECYDEEGNLICGLPIILEHVHGEECFHIEELSDEEVARLNEQNKETEATDETEEETSEGTDETLDETGEKTGDGTDGETEEGQDRTSESEGDLLDVSGGDVSGGDVSAGDLITAVFEDSKVRITATYGPEANLPEEAELLAYEVTPEVERYESRMEEALNVLKGQTGAGETVPEEGEPQEASETSEPQGNAESQETSDGQESTGAQETAGAQKDTASSVEYQIVIYNIGFYVDGEEVEPEAPVNVTIQFLDENGMVIREGVSVLHFAEREEKTEVEVLEGAPEASENAVNFDVDSFSDLVIALEEKGKEASIFKSIIWYTMAGVSVTLTTSLLYKKTLGERRFGTSRN